MSLKKIKCKQFFKKNFVINIIQSVSRQNSLKNKQKNTFKTFTKS